MSAGTTIALANTFLREYVTPGVPSSGYNNPAKSDGVTTFADVEARLTSLEQASALNSVVAPSWTALSAISGANNGEVGQVIGDSGSHVDPVTGITVQNSGTYTWVSASSAWEWVSSSYPDLIDPAASAMSVGELIGRMRTNYAFLNGATAEISGSIIVGMDIPAGQTGYQSYINASLPMSAAEIAALNGKTIAIKVACLATSGFINTHPFNNIAVEVGFSTGVHGGSVLSIVQSGNVFTREVSYTVAGTETDLAVVLQIGTTSTSGSDANFSIKSITYRILTDLTAVAGSVDAETAALAIALAAPPRSGIGDIFPDFFTNNTYALGASALYGVDDRALGWTIPSGSYAGSSTLQFIWAPDNADLALLIGRTIKVTVGFNCNSQYARLLSPSLYVYTASGAVLATDARVTRNLKTSSTRIVVEMTGVFQSDDIYLAPTIANGPDGTTGQTDWILATDLRVEIVATPSDTFTAGDENATLAQRIAERRAVNIAYGPRALAYGVRKTIAPSSGDYTSVTAAIAATTYAGQARKVELLVQPGTYFDVAWATINFVDVRGAVKDLAVINAAQASSASLALITNNSALNAFTNSRLSSLTISATNLRYVIHADSYLADPSSVLVIEDCHLVHNGNASARAYQTGLGGSGNPSGVWNQECALGFGASDGCELQVKRCLLVGGFVGSAVAGHNNRDFTNPYRVLFEGCDIVLRDPANYAFTFGSFGSRQSDVIEMIGNSISGPINLYFTPWLTTNAVDQVANKAEIIWRGYGNAPTPFVQTDDGSRALRINSATTGTSSSVTVSGSAVAVLFGNVITYAGAAGVSGGVYGTWDIGNHQVGPNSDQNITQLGYRLGDCTTNNLSLVVTVNGGSPITITFNSNYTSSSNATIEGIINTALGAAATCYEFNVNDLFRPKFLDEEIFVENTDTTTILRKSAVKFDSGPQTGKVMLSTDSPSIFAGIAYEDIRPGQWGRVKCAGAVRVANDLLRSDSASFAIGSTFGVGATAGQFVVNPSAPLLWAINASDVALKRPANVPAPLYAVGQWYQLASSSSPASVTGTYAETALATVTIPANAMGPNGMIRVSALWSCTNNANAKEFIVRFGGAAGTKYLDVIMSGYPGFIDIDRIIANRNAANSQVGKAANSSTGIAGAAAVTSSVDTTAATTLILAAANANLSDTTTLESYTVEIMHR